MPFQHLKVRIERGLEAYGRWVVRFAWLVTALVLLALAGLAAQLPGLAFDTSTESFFRKGDPVLITYERFREQYGRDELVLIAVESPEVFDLGFLRTLKDFHQALESEVPYVKEVTSLVNVRDTRGEGDTLIVEDLLETFPETPEAMAALRERVLASPLYRNFLISEDGRLTAVVVETEAYSLEGAGADPLAGDLWKEGTDAAPAPRIPLTDRENSELVNAVRGVIDRFETGSFELHLTGSPVVTDHLKRAMQSNMARFILLAILSIGAFLFLLFRRISGTVIPLLVVLASVVATVGVVVASGHTFKLPQMVLPSFLLAVGVGASVHLLAIFYRRYEATENKREAVAYALGHSGLPIVMTSLTTAAGLFSFASAAMASVGELGLFAGIGVLISLVLTLTLTPSLLTLLPLREHPRWFRRGTNPLSDRALTGLARFSTRHAAWVLAVSTVLVISAVAGLSHLRFAHNTLSWFPKSTEIRRTTDLMDREMKGSVTLEVLVDTGVENGLYEPEVLDGMLQLARFAEAYRDASGKPFVGKTNSVADVVREINQALNGNDPAFYRLPTDRELIAQELLLFENSGNDDLSRLVDSRFSQARISFRTPWRDAGVYVDFVQAIDRQARDIFGERAETHVTGLIHLFTRSIAALMESMITSYTIAIVVITVLMILLIGRLGLGLLSMIPNLLPIVLTLGLMGWADIPLDAFTLLIGSIALGLAVDDTIHFFHNYMRYQKESGSMQKAVEETLLSTGRAMLFATLVLVTGFWLFMFASLNNLFYFGLLTGITLIVALLADLMVAPAMLRFIHGRT